MLNEQETYLKNVQATFRYYCYHVHNEGRNVETDGYLWYPSKFHTYLCDTVQEFVEKESDFPAGEILIINTPPQVGKSTTVTETLPSWYKMRYPDKGVIVTAYGDDLAKKFGRANLNKMKRYQGLFSVNLNKNKSTSQEIELKDHKNACIFKGIGSSLTGFTGNLIIMDDPVKNREDADSEGKRSKLWEEFNDTVLTRLNSGDKLILIMTRWHEDDLAARIIKEMPERTTVINIPCECDESDDPLGRAIGEPICPEIGRDEEWVEDKKRTVSSEEGLRTWNALYQGRPSAKAGNIFKRDWWQFYDYKDFTDGTLKMDTVMMSVDATFKDKEKNDYVAIQVWGKRGAYIYLLDSINEHLNFPDTVRKIRVLKARYQRINAILIEDKANGSAIIQTLHSEVGGIIPVEPKGGKVARAENVSLAVEAGNVFLPREKKFTWEFIDQCCSFPNAKHDDIVDAFSQCLSRLVHTRTLRSTMHKLTKDEWGRREKKPQGFGKGEEINVI